MGKWRAQASVTDKKKRPVPAIANTVSVPHSGSVDLTHPAREEEPHPEEERLMQDELDITPGEEE